MKQVCRVRARTHSLGWLLLGLALPLVVSGCKTTGAGVIPAQSMVVPEWPTLSIQSLAYLGTGSAAGDEMARVTAEQLVEDQLRSSQDRFVVLPFREAQTRAGGAKLSEAFDKVVKVWRDSRTVDKFLAQQLCGGLGVDGLILADLSEWKKEKVDWTVEGTSYSRVGLRLCIYSGKTGLLAWEAEKVQRKDSQPYRPGAPGDGVYTDRDGVSRLSRPSMRVPEPPAPEEVATDAVRAILAALPARSPAR